MTLSLWIFAVSVFVVTGAMVIPTLYTWYKRRYK